MGQPKLPFYIVVSLVIISLIGFATYRSGVFSHNASAQTAGNASKTTSAPLEDTSPANSQPPTTTVKEYNFKKAEKLPDVKGISGYRPLEDNTVRFALNVWAGWGPMILANDGFKPGKVWKTPDGKEFKVELVLIDNPVAMRDAYAAGEVQIGWGTLDMVPLILEGFVDKMGKPRDPRAMPRIYQQIDYSNGGDGVVVRDNIKTVRDLRGKKVVLAQNSPSQFLLLSLLTSTEGIQPSEVEMVFTEDAFQAAAAFNAQKDIAGVVSWAPDIYNLADVKGNRMLVNTQTANKLIADVWFARADFAKDRPDIIEGLVRGIFDGMEDLKKEDRKAHCAQLMADGYSIPAADTIKMFGDAHSTNWAENNQFFLNPSNPANFESTWKKAYQLYRRIGSITHQPMAFTQVMDPSMIQKLGSVDKYKSSQDEYQTHMVAKSAKAINAESDEIFTKAIVINFPPNNWDVYAKIQKDVDGKLTEVAYDPNVANVLKDVADITAKFGAARVIVRGHTDSSRKGQIDAGAVKELSLNRAVAVKDALTEKYAMDANRFAAEGLGWEEPADPQDPNNQPKNRRVEIKIFSAEKQ